MINGVSSPCVILFKKALNTSDTIIKDFIVLEV
jgi:hypothetical protein